MKIVRASCGCVVIPLEDVRAPEDESVIECVKLQDCRGEDAELRFVKTVIGNDKVAAGRPLTTKEFDTVVRTVNWLVSLGYDVIQMRRLMKRNTPPDAVTEPHFPEEASAGD